MIEVERKILGIEVSDLVKTIEALPKTQGISVRKTFEGRVRINYYDFPDGSIRAKKDLLRVREFIPDDGSTATVEVVYKTYGGVKDNSKVFDECELGLPPGTKFTGENLCETWKSFLEKLGLMRVVYYEKNRTHYDCGAFKCEIDAHPKIPAFVEIEAKSGAEIDAAVNVLGLEGYDQTSETISELLARAYPHLTLADLTF